MQTYLQRTADNPKYSDIISLMQSLDVDADGQIDITEFVAAALDTRLLLDDEKLRSAFQAMDMNKDGMLSMAELLSQLDGDTVVYDLMTEGDTNKDGKLSLAEFRIVAKNRVNEAKSAIKSTTS